MRPSTKYGLWHTFWLSVMLYFFLDFERITWVWPAYALGLLLAEIMGSFIQPNLKKEDQK